MLREAEQQKSEKQKAGRRCPHCGTPVDVFASHCPSCGFELRDRQSSSAVKNLADKLLELEQKEPSLERVHRAKMQILRDFQVPKGHEDLMELLTLSVPNCKDKGFLPHLMTTSTIRFWSLLAVLSLAAFLFVVIADLLTIPKDDILYGKTFKIAFIFVFGAMIFNIPLSIMYAKKGLPDKYVRHNEEAVIWRKLAKEAIARLRPQATSQQEREKIDEMEKQIK